MSCCGAQSLKTHVREAPTVGAQHSSSSSDEPDGVIVFSDRRGVTTFKVAGESFQKKGCGQCGPSRIQSWKKAQLSADRTMRKVSNASSVVILGSPHTSSEEEEPSPSPPTVPDSSSLKKRIQTKKAV